MMMTGDPISYSQHSQGEEMMEVAAKLLESCVLSGPCAHQKALHKLYLKSDGHVSRWSTRSEFLSYESLAFYSVLECYGMTEPGIISNTRFNFKSWQLQCSLKALVMHCPQRGKCNSLRQRLIDDSCWEKPQSACILIN